MIKSFLLVYFENIVGVIYKIGEYNHQIIYKISEYNHQIIYKFGE
jgi:hypothetical protein